LQVGEHPQQLRGGGITAERVQVAAVIGVFGANVADLDAVGLFEMSDQFEDASGIDDPLLQKGIVVAEGVPPVEPEIVNYEAVKVCSEL